MSLLAFQENQNYMEQSMILLACDKLEKWYNNF